jgi:hypothetical protein
MHSYGTETLELDSADREILKKWQEIVVKRVEEDAERVAAHKREENTLSRSWGQQFANIEA